MVAVARGWGQGCDLQQGDPSPFSVPKSWPEAFTVEIMWSCAISPQQFSACFLSQNEKLKLKPFQCEHPCQLQHSGVHRGSQRATQMCHTPLKTGSTLTQRELEIWCNSSNEGVTVSNRVSAHCHLLFQLFSPSFLFSAVDEIPTLPAEANQLKLEKDTEGSYISYGFSQHRHYCLIHSALSMTGFHNFLCRIMRQVWQQSMLQGIVPLAGMDLSGM